MCEGSEDEGEGGWRVTTLLTGDIETGRFLA